MIMENKSASNESPLVILSWRSLGTPSILLEKSFVQPLTLDGGKSVSSAMNGNKKIVLVQKILYLIKI